MAKVVNTVTGPVEVDKLGVTLMHEHFWFSYAGHEGQTLYTQDRKELVENGLKIAEKAKSYGVQTIVDATALDCGRKPEALKEISERSGLNIIMSTGYSYEAEGGGAYFRFKNMIGQGPDELYELLMSEITKGYKDTGIKPGVIKIGTSLNTISPYEESNYRVSARVSKETGTPIVAHTEAGTMGPEAAELLLSSGAAPGKVVMYHMCGNTSIPYHKRVLKQGVFEAFDRFGVEGLLSCPTDEERIAVLLGLLGTGYIDQLMMSHDTVNQWLGKPPVWPEGILTNHHVGHIFEDIIPVMKKAGVTDEQINKILIDNPRRLFS